MINMSVYVGLRTSFHPRVYSSVPAARRFQFLLAYGKKPHSGVRIRLVMDTI